MESTLRGGEYTELLSRFLLSWISVLSLLINLRTCILLSTLMDLCAFSPDESQSFNPACSTAFFPDGSTEALFGFLHFIYFLRCLLLNIYYFYFFPAFFTSCLPLSLPSSQEESPCLFYVFIQKSHIVITKECRLFLFFFCIC